MKKGIFFICICCFICFTAKAQEYLIKHDALTDKTIYYKIINQNKDTVKIDQINLKKQSQINLVVDEFNPFYWGAKVTTYKNSIDEATGSANVFNPFGLFAKALQGFLPGNFPLMDLATEKSRGANGNSAEEKMLRLVQAYSQNYNEIKSLSLQYNSLKNLEWQLNQLKYNNKKTEADIKSSTTEAVSKLIPVEQLKPDKILVFGNDMDAHTKEVIDSFTMLKEQIQLTANTIDANEAISNDKTAKDILAEMNKGKASVESFTQTALVKPTIFTEEVLAVGKLYNEITSTPFKYSYIVNSDPDISQLRLSMYSKIDSASRDTITKYFPIHNRNTIRLRNSLGLIFTYFGDDHSYFARPDSSIGRGRGNLFSPAIGTFINFYKSGQTGLKWGGALGFGLPLQGDVKDFQFLFGLSFIIGRNEPVIITVGAAGGKLNKLKNGWQVGDKVTPENFNNLTKSVYDIGAFFSISLNLSSIAPQKK